MPELTGFHLNREILKIRTSLPIIFRSGYTAQVERSQVIRSGIGAFLSKPISRIVLSLTIPEILKKKRS